MWIDGQQRYNDFTASDRLTLSTAFHKAGWHTVCVSAADNGPWPEGSVYHYDDFINVDALHYQGPKFGYAGIPDQYTMSTFQQDERTPGHAPLFAEIDLMSSHSPWTPLPRSIPWSAVGDGNAYHSQITGPVSDGLGRSSAQVRTDYGKTIEYSLSTMVSYVQQYGDPNLVVVMLGDHQPAEQVSGQNASRDVPITIISQDASVMSRVDGWGWSAGLRPAPSAPVWKMDAFRDHFLSSFAR
ncbi:sulfatase-like hydrolase/transferase [Hamadaea tsunoensis]|uniref:sulfatase-like hydrolase/transferase n=1 Tax=Hamadaea tsunoensis TaxID=53368 RepID=UPI00389939A3